MAKNNYIQLVDCYSEHLHISPQQSY